ncbi:MAG: hypothetical protein JNL58_26890 [Planctomyces sp.]|nr:hypothetical protein [Planctomyces sp.]
MLDPSNVPAVGLNEMLSRFILTNPNHVNITNWPSAADKPAQKLIAQEIAAVARFLPTPESHSSAIDVTE